MEKLRSGLLKEVKHNTSELQPRVIANADNRKSGRHAGSAQNVAD